MRVPFGLSGVDWTCVRKHSSPLYPGLDAAAFRRRTQALERFARWDAQARSTLPPATGIDSVAFLYELLPPASRRRPVETSGIGRLHRALSVLGRLAG